MDACKPLFFTLAFFMLTDAADVSENSEAFVCSMEETSGKGTLYNSSAVLSIRPGSSQSSGGYSLANRRLYSCIPH